MATAPEIVRLKDPTQTIPFRTMIEMITLLVVTSIPPPAGLEWRDARADIRGVHALLADSYVASADRQVRIRYSHETVAWMLGAAHSSLQLGLGVPGEQSLVGFVSAMPSSLIIRGSPREDSVEVTLLCVRCSWRKRGLVPMLLAELRCRAAALGVQSAIYTAAQPRGQPLVCAACFHRPLRPHRLHQLRFWEPVLTTSGRLEAAIAEAARLPHPPAGVASLQPLGDADCRDCHELHRRRGERSALGRLLSPEEFRYRYGRGSAARSFIARGEDGTAAGFVSFLLVPLQTPGGDVVQVRERPCDLAACAVREYVSGH